MSIATTPREILRINIEDAICAVDRLRHFLSLLEQHADDTKVRDFLLGEVEAVAEIAEEHVNRIGSELK